MTTFSSSRPTWRDLIKSQSFANISQHLNPHYTTVGGQMPVGRFYPTVYETVNEYKAHKKNYSKKYFPIVIVLIFNVKKLTICTD